MKRWQWLLHQLNKKLWLRSSLFCIAGILSALFALVVKDFIPEGMTQEVGADAVDKILEIIATSMLAVTTFSLSTMVSAYAAASSNVTPHSTKLLLEDNTAQNALSTFIGSFLFSLVGIIALSMGIYGNSGRLVLFVVTIAVIGLIITVLLRWIHYLSQLGRVGHTIAMVERATSKALHERLQHPYLGGTSLINYVPEATHYAIIHPHIGYIQNIDVAALSEMAERLELQFYLQDLPGSFNDAHQPTIYCSKPLAGSDIETVQRAFSIGADRSFEQDPRYGIIVFSEIASRALSPAVNDPGTAIDIIGASLRTLAPWVTAELPHPAEIIYPRLHVPVLQTAELFDDIYTRIGRDGAAMIEVCIRLQKALASFAAMGNVEARREAHRHATMAYNRGMAGLKLPADRELLTTTIGKSLLTSEV